MTKSEEKYLPNEILQKAIVSGNEYGWKRTDFEEVLNKAVAAGLGIIGGQVQFKFTDGTCELYWHKYDSTERKPDEDWKDYCNRTKDECITQFQKLPGESELVDEGIKHFDFLREKHKSGHQIQEHLIYIIYFNDLETGLE